MQQCPKCFSSVPDGRTECQICGAALDPEAAKTAGPLGLKDPTQGPRPLTEEEAAELRPGIPGIDRGGAPQEMDVLAKQIGGGMPAQQGGVELKRTLSGEVIEVPVSTPQRPGGPMLGRGAGPVPPPSPIPTARPGGRPVVPPLRTGAGPVVAGEAAARSGSSAGVLLVILLVIVLAAGGGGYWYWLQTRPAATVREFVENVNKHDWGAVYDQIELPAQLKGALTKDAFRQLMALGGGSLKIENYEIKGSRIEGDTATVNLAATVSIGSFKQTDTNEVKLRKVDGVWKIDATSGAPRMPGMATPRLPNRH